LAVLAGETYGLLCDVLLVMDFEKAITVMVVVSLTTMAAAGFYVKNIPSFLVWIFQTWMQGCTNVGVIDHDFLCDGSDVLAEEYW
jgi:hypothetical protein